jgi:hypothetical protein
LRQGEVDVESGRDVGAAGIDVDERHLHGRIPPQQPGDAAAHHAGAHDGYPVADGRGGVPQRVDCGLDGAGKHRAGGRDALRHDRYGAGRYNRPLVR